MKLKLAILLCFLSVVVRAQPPFLRNPYTTGTVAQTDARVTGLGSNYAHQVFALKFSIWSNGVPVVASGVISNFNFVGFALITNANGQVSIGAPAGDVTTAQLNSAIARTMPALLIVPSDNLSDVAATNGPNRLLIASNGTYTINTNLVFSSPIQFMPNAVFAISNTARVVLSNYFIASPGQQIKSGLGTLSLTNNVTMTLLRPAAFGNTSSNAPADTLQQTINAATIYPAEMVLTDAGLTQNQIDFFRGHLPAARKVEFDKPWFVQTNAIVISNQWHGHLDGNSAWLLMNKTNGIGIQYDDVRSYKTENLYIKFQYQTNSPAFAGIWSKNISDTTVTPYNNFWQNVHVDGHLGGVKYGFLFGGYGVDANNEFHTVMNSSAFSYRNAGFAILGSQSKNHLFFNSHFGGDIGTAEAGVRLHDPELALGSGSFTWVGGGGGANRIAGFVLPIAPLEPVNIFSGQFENDKRDIVTGWYFVRSNLFTWATNGSSLLGTNAYVRAWTELSGTNGVELTTNVVFTYTANKWTYEWLDEETNFFRATADATFYPYNASKGNGTLVNVVQCGASGITNVYSPGGEMQGSSSTAAPITAVGTRASGLIADDGIIYDIGHRGPLNLIGIARNSYNAHARFRVFGGGTVTNHGGSIVIAGSKFRSQLASAPPSMKERIIGNLSDGSFGTNDVDIGFVKVFTYGNVFESASGLPLPAREYIRWLGDAEWFGDFKISPTNSAFRVNDAGVASFSTNKLTVSRDGVGINTDPVAGWPLTFQAVSGGDNLMLFRTGAGAARGYFGLSSVSGALELHLYNAAGSEKVKLSPVTPVFGLSAVDGITLGINTNTPQAALHVNGDGVGGLALFTDYGGVEHRGIITSTNLDARLSNNVRVAAGTGGITVTPSGSAGVMTYTISDDDAGGGGGASAIAVWANNVEIGTNVQVLEPTNSPTITWAANSNATGRIKITAEVVPVYSTNWDGARFMLTNLSVLDAEKLLVDNAAHTSLASSRTNDWFYAEKTNRQAGALWLQSYANANRASTARSYYELVVDTTNTVQETRVLNDTLSSVGMTYYNALTHAGWAESHSRNAGGYDWVVSTEIGGQRLAFMTNWFLVTNGNVYFGGALASASADIPGTANIGTANITNAVFEFFSAGRITETSNTTEFAGSGITFKAIDLNLGDTWKNTNAPNGNIVADFQNLHKQTNNSFTVTWNGTAAGGADRYITNTFSSVIGSVPTVFSVDGAATVTSFTLTLTNGWATELNGAVDFLEGTNHVRIVTGYWRR